MQVAVQRIGLFRCQQRCAVCLCQHRHTVLVDQLNVVGVDAEFQCRALAVVVTLGRKNAVQIIKVRRAVGEADIAVRLEHLAANRLNQRGGQILCARLLLDVHVRLRTGLYQRDRRSVKIASSTIQTISSTSVVPFWFFKRCFMGWSSLLPCSCCSGKTCAVPSFFGRFP